MIVVNAKIIIDGKTLKAPTTVSIQRNKLWNQEAGRTITGDFTGNVIRRKYRLDITWKYLSENEAAEISAALDPDFIQVTFQDPRTKQMITKTFYAGDEVYTVYNYAVEKCVYEGLPISLVEK